MKRMNLLAICGAISVVLLAGCAVSSPIKKISESESAFSDDPASRIKPQKGSPDIYRIYDRAATGFVSIGAVREGLEERARKFCDDKAKTLHELESEQSDPPYILGNFPRMELIFTCDTKAQPKAAGAPPDKYGELEKLKRLLDTGALTEAEFDSEKRKVLGVP